MCQKIIKIFHKKKLNNYIMSNRGENNHRKEKKKPKQPNSKSSQKGANKKKNK